MEKKALSLNPEKMKDFNKKRLNLFSCMYLFSCVVPEPIYGHLRGFSGSGLPTHNKYIKRAIKRESLRS